MKKLLKITFTLIFTTILLLGFAVPLNLNGFWYQQFLPNLNNRPISDITFLDSLTGYAVTPYMANDTAYIIKTINKGDDWSIIYRQPTNTIGAFTRIIFLNQNTGFAGGNFLYKTTNAGTNWFQVNIPFGNLIFDMSVLDQDTIILVDSDGLVGGVFKTTNGGVNWTVNNSTKPDKIYMYNCRIGFCSRGGTFLYKTTNSGNNWNLITGTTGFTDIKFSDTITGWKCSNINGTPYFDKTTNGGMNWFNQVIPSGGLINTPEVASISILNSDTVWAAGGEAFYGAGQFRGILYRTTNGGNNWLFNVPDTTIHLGAYSHIQLLNKNTGWAYNSSGGIHTTNGGDTTFLVGLQQISSEVPNKFMLFQNYPNPFNPKTNIMYSVKRESSNVKLIVYDIQGRVVTELVNQKQTSGTYEVDWNAAGYSSGIYFYSLIINSSIIDSKKMILIK